MKFVIQGLAMIGIDLFMVNTDHIVDCERVCIKLYKTGKYFTFRLGFSLAKMFRNC